MELIISIVSWNTRELLQRCLTSLEKYCRRGHTRIIVIDNASSDGSPEMVRNKFPDVILVDSGGNLGFGKAHNLVALHSKEPFILFLNPDTEFTENAHERMLEVFQKDPHVGLVGCRMTNLDGTIQPLGLQWNTSPWTEFLTGLLVSKSSVRFVRSFLPFHDPTQDGYVRKLYGGGLMARRSVLDHVGWFDDQFFMYGEDVDLSRRVKISGFRLYYLSTARIVHLCGGASAKAPGRFSTLMQCESIAKLCEKYYGPSGRLLYILSVQARALVRISMLYFLQPLAWFRGPKSSQILQDSRGKYVAMLKWSLGILRPLIPS